MISVFTDAWTRRPWSTAYTAFCAFGIVALLVLGWLGVI